MPTSDSTTLNAAVPRSGLESSDHSILVFRIGSLGDTLVSLPSFWAIRENFPGAKITLLCDKQVGRKYVLAADVLRGSGTVDDFLIYPAKDGRLSQLTAMIGLMWKLRRRRFRILIYLAPSLRDPQQIERDRRFFRLAGIRRLIGMGGFQPRLKRAPDHSLATLSYEADLLLRRLASDGLRVPPPGHGRMDLGIGQVEQEEVDRWLARLPSSEGRNWIAVAPGSKMPAKIWPVERYAQVVKQLIEAYDVWPVVVGGTEDREVGNQLLATWGRGYIAAGELGLRASAAAISRCRLYVGNDTVAMHLATAVGVPCVAIFSSRAQPGLWYPYGTGHHVFRTPIDCEGCELQICIERQMECIRRIGIDEVVQACAHTLAQPRADRIAAAGD